ncbi:DNA polymerase delta subunit 4-like [Plakobranchus ocellatus]|uniref:DNA polymerase delta subunit 4-like n=1 Tax=Plakobranchus ocellatus TaxID=259542 RepID=A0AAV4AQW0_9GAST|nr:DNA polymerase delta subunit 4-like [Plakobranchus ocellatus]
MASISNAFVQRKRIAHKPKKGAPSTSGVKEEKVDASVKRDLDILKQFDLTLEYGPCIGISRLDRWERAEKHGLKPLPEVRDLLIRHAADPLYTECLWNDFSTLR